MFKNYFLIALRTIATNRLFSIINILGLALGLAYCMLIIQFVNYERSYDTHGKDADRIYRMSRHYPKSNDEIARVPATLNPLLETSFLDERFNAMYDNEEKQASMFLLFSSLAILITSLGLYGPATFSTDRRTKENDIRKVLVASVHTIVFLLTREFSLLILWANIIAWPSACFAMSIWLERFNHAISLNPLIFIAVSLFALALAWLTVAIQAARAATARPTQSLRYE